MKPSNQNCPVKKIEYLLSPKGQYEQLKEEEAALIAEKDLIYSKGRNVLLKFLAEKFDMPMRWIGKNAFAFTMTRPDGLKEDFCTIDFMLDYKTDKFSKIELGYYSTTESSDFELTRLVNIGKIASVIKSHQSEMLSKMDDVEVEFDVIPVYVRLAHVKNELVDISAKLNYIIKS